MLTNLLLTTLAAITLFYLLPKIYRTNALKWIFRLLGSGLVVLIYLYYPYNNIIVFGSTLVGALWLLLKVIETVFRIGDTRTFVWRYFIDCSDPENPRVNESLVEYFILDPYTTILQHSVIPTPGMPKTDSVKSIINLASLKSLSKGVFFERYFNTKNFQYNSAPSLKLRLRLWLDKVFGVRPKRVTSCQRKFLEQSVSIIGSTRQRKAGPPIQLDVNPPKESNEWQPVQPEEGEVITTNTMDRPDFDYMDDYYKGD